MAHGADLNYTNFDVNNGSTFTVGSGDRLVVGSGSGDRLHVASGGGTTGTLDASDSLGVTANVGTFYVGTGSSGGTGTATLGAVNSITAATLFGVGTSFWDWTTGTLNMPAGSTTTINTPDFKLGWAIANGTSSGTGSMTLGAGGSLTVQGLSGGRTQMWVGYDEEQYGRSSSGLLDLSAGTASLRLSSLMVGGQTGNGTTPGTLTMGTSGSNHLDISGAGNVLRIGYLGLFGSNGSGGGNGTVTLANLDGLSQITSTDDGTAILLGERVATASGSTTGTLNLVGGTLRITTGGTAIGTRGSGGTSNLNLDGITLVAGSSSTAWIQGLTNARVRAGGVTFDTAGHDIGVPQRLVEDAASTGGGLSKLGGGTLTLSGVNTFTGPVSVSGGRLVVTSGSQLLSSSVTLGSAAELQYRGTSPLAAPVFAGTGSTLDAVGTITGAVDVTAGNTLAVGGSTLAMSGLTLGTNTTVRVESGGTSLVQVNGDYADSLGAHTLVTGLATPGQAYTFLSWTGSSGSLPDGPQSNWTIQEGDTGTKKWGSGSSGSWDTASAWDGFLGAVSADIAAKTLSYELTYVASGTKAPSGGNDVVIDPLQAGLSVTGPASAAAVKSLQVGGGNASSPTLALGPGTLSVTQAVTVTGNGLLDATNGALVAPTLNVDAAAAAVTLGHGSNSVATANVSAGTLTVDGGTVSTVNLTGTGNFAGSLAVPQVNVTGGTPTLSGRAVTVTVSGGGVATSGGIVTTLQHSPGAGTSTIDATSNVTNLIVAAGTVNYGSAAGGSTLTMPVASTGTLVIGAGAVAAVLDLESGAGTVTAVNPLAVSDRILFPGKLSARTSGPAFTVQAAADANLMSNAAERTFTVNGGTFTLATLGSPATTGISYFQVTDDTSSGLDSTKSYTHAIDWGSSGAATVNGVAFATDVNVSAGGRSNAGTRTYGSAGAHGGNTPPAVSGNVASVFQDMVFGGPDPGYVELTGLAPNTWYDVRLYERAWDYGGAVRTYYNLFDVGADGVVEYTTPKIDQNRGNLTPPGMPGNVSWITSYVYQADATGKMRVTIDLAPDQGGSYHLYGLSNEVAPSGSGVNNFLDTHIVVTSSASIDLGSASAAHTLGNITVQGIGTTVAFSGAQSVSFNGIASPGSGSIAAGTPISLRGGGVSVAAGQTMTVNANLVDGNFPTTLTKSGPGRLVLTGSNTYTGGTVIDAGVLDVAAGSSVDMFGDVTINGGTLRYNSSVPLAGAVAFNAGTLGGTNLTGSLGGLTIGSDRTISPGNSPGTAATDSQTWAGGGAYLWEVNDAVGTAGTAFGWDLLSGTDTLTISATSSDPFRIAVTSLTLGNESGTALGFDPTLDSAWLIADFGNPIAGFDAAAFTIDTSGFANPFGGAFGIALGTSGTLGGDDSQLFLTYAAVPEPSGCVLLGALGAAALMLRRRVAA